MILLRRLRVQALKHLREVDIWFPRRGSVLIEGQNESGKSTLFEAIYFALYGQPLVGEESRARLEDLLPHKGEPAVVELAVEASGIQLEIRRTLTRAAGGGRGVRHEARLRLDRPGAAREEVHGAAPVSARILQALSGLDGDALRNSCFMEQQALDRVEALSRGQREAAIAHLLGIERLRRVEDDLKAELGEQQRVVERRRSERDAAMARHEAGAAGGVAAHAQQRLHAGHVRDALLRRDTLGRELAEVRRDVAHGEGGHDVLENRLERIAQAERALAAAQRAEASASALAREIEGREAVAAAETELTQTERTLVAAERAAHRAELRQALLRWLRTQEVAELAEGGQAREDALLAQRTAAEAGLGRARMANRRAGFTTAGALAAALALAGVGLAWHFVWLAALTALLIAALAAWRWQGARAEHARAQDAVAQSARALADVQSRRAIAAQLTGASDGLLAPEAVAAAAGFAPPRSPDEARGLLAQLEAGGLDGRETERLREATAERAARRATLQLARERLGAAAPDDELGLDALRGRLADTQAARRAQEQTLSELAGQLGVAPDAASLAAARGAAETRLTEQQHTLAQRLAAAEGAYTAAVGEVRALLDQVRLRCGGDELAEALRALWPPLAAVGATPLAELEEAQRAAETEAYHRRKLVADAAQADATADVGESRARLEAAEREAHRHGLALALAQQARTRIVRRVLPETEVYMRALLPELTAGRYRDARLLADDANGSAAGADLKIALWDEVAGRHVAKGLFSGGTRDQVSLALRLAFALATLPKELGAMPGFIVLDEPLSSFDDERSLALVRVLTEGTIARAFPQVLLIAHSQAFDRAAFTYSLRMAGGRVVESSLPDGRAAEALWRAEALVAVALPSA